MPFTQVVDTNPNETYHSTLKFNPKGQRFSLTGLIKHVVTISGWYFVRARNNRANFRGSKVALPGLALLPVPVQKLVAEDFKQAHRLVQQDEPLRPGLGLSQDWDEDEEEVAGDVALAEIACDCRFFRAWIPAAICCTTIYNSRLFFMIGYKRRF